MAPLAVLLLLVACSANLRTCSSFATPNPPLSINNSPLSCSSKDVQELRVNGMSCNGCLSRVLSAVRTLDPAAQVTLHPPRMILKGDADVDAVNRLLSSAGSYSAEYIPGPAAPSIKSFVPLLVVAAGITLSTLVAQRGVAVFSLATAMRHFMSGYFLVFSTLKLINLRGFVRSFEQYDLIARRFKAYGYAYPFIELLLGIFSLLDIKPLAVNSSVFVIMAASSAGVLNALRSNQKLTCACLGASFNVPMTFVTLAEDLLMTAMALFCIVARKTHRAM